MTNDNTRRLQHMGDDNAFIERLKHAVPTLPALVAQNIEASPIPVCAMRVYAEVGTFAGSGKLREVHTSTASDSASADGLVCEVSAAGSEDKVGHE